MRELSGAVPQDAKDFQAPPDRGQNNTIAITEAQGKEEEYADPSTVPWTAEQIKHPEDLYLADVGEEKQESRAVYYGTIKGLHDLGIRPTIIKGNKPDSHVMAYPIDLVKEVIGGQQGNQRTFLVLYRNGHSTEMVLPCKQDGSLSEDLQLNMDQMPLGSNAFEYQRLYSQTNKILTNFILGGGSFSAQENTDVFVELPNGKYGYEKRGVRFPPTDTEPIGTLPTKLRNLLQSIPEGNVSVNAGIRAVSISLEGIINSHLKRTI